MVDHSIALICTKISVSVNVEAKIVVSERGDILSPKYAPDMIAPAVYAGLIPIAVPMPIIATPTVPAVPHDVPVATEITQQNKKVNGRKNFGVIIFIPATRMEGMVPAAIKAAIIIPTARIIAEDGIHFFADS